MTERVSVRRPDALPRPLPIPEPAEPAEPLGNNLGRVELRCTGCGYGAIAKTMPAQCPMCASTIWDFTVWRPFSRRAGTEPEDTPRRPQAQPNKR